MRVQHPRATDADGRPAPSAASIPGHGTIKVNDDGDLVVDDERVAAAAKRTLAEAYDVSYTDDGQVVLNDGDAVDPPFDPSDLSVAELKDRLAGRSFTDGELAALVDAEERGDGRTTALNALTEAQG